MTEHHESHQPDQSPSSPKPPPSPPPPRGPSTLVLLGCLGAVLILIMVVSVSLVVGALFSSPIKSAYSQMRTAVGGRTDDTEQESKTTQYYTCGMHPWVILPKPGNCPICSMKLVPLDPAKFTGQITIDPVVVQNMGVRIGPVITGPLIRSIRTVGSVDYDETRVRDVNIKVPGWIEKLHIDYLGAEVKQGEPLFEIYSPELYAAQEEYLLAYSNRNKVGVEFLPEAAEGAADLLEATRTRLLYFDITAEQIEDLQQKNQPTKTMSILSPHEGVVIEKHANEGMRVDLGMRVYRIADLSKVWVMVTLYEYQLPYVQAGQRASMTLPYIPGQTFEGKVIYIYPYLDKKTREVSIRLEFDNPGLLLKPGMFVNVQLRNQLARERTLAPRAAIIDTGERQVAFVSQGQGKFEPREVQIGIETEGGMVEVLSGLKPGEMVVTSGQFLIDSEAKMREALAKMIKGDLAADQKATAMVSGESELTSLPDTAAQTLAAILDDYFAIGDQLASDATDGIAPFARKVAQGINSLLGTEIPEDPHFWHRHEEAATVRGKALELVSISDLEEARLKYADLSVALLKLTKATGVPPAYPAEVQELHCAMYREGQGGSIWLQPAGDVRNPFFGLKMLGHFNKRTTLPVTGDMHTNPQ